MQITCPPEVHEGLHVPLWPRCNWDTGNADSWGRRGQGLMGRAVSENRPRRTAMDVRERLPLGRVHWEKAFLKVVSTC